MHESEIPTPYLAIDRETALANIRRMAEYARGHGLALRPHTKTHKSMLFARWQMEAGASGLTVAKAGEATVMRGASNRILMAYPAVDAHRAGALARLAKDAEIWAAVDSAAAADALAAAAGGDSVSIGILVDVDVGHHRTGTQTPEEALYLARHIDGLKGITLEGIMVYPGHITAPVEDQPAKLAEASAYINKIIELWRDNGLEAKTVSGGSTPTAFRSHLMDCLTEIRPGTYIFNDRNTLSGGFCEAGQCAARIVSTVVSRAVPGKAAIDAGTKTLTSDLLMGHGPEAGFGLVTEHPDARIVRLSEEHGELDLSECGETPELGERLSIIPNHICPCVNLRDEVWLIDPDGSAERIPVEARGMVA